MMKKKISLFHSVVGKPGTGGCTGGCRLRGVCFWGEARETVLEHVQQAEETPWLEAELLRLRSPSLYPGLGLVALRRRLYVVSAC